jgi:hypothetical protein
MQAYYGSGMDFMGRITWDANDPNVLRLSMPKGVSVRTRVSGTPSPGNMHALRTPAGGGLLGAWLLPALLPGPGSGARAGGRPALLLQVTRRSEVLPGVVAPDRLETSEYLEQVFDNSSDGEPLHAVAARVAAAAGMMFVSCARQALSACHDAVASPLPHPGVPRLPASSPQPTPPSRRPSASPSTAGGARRQQLGMAGQP